MNRERMLELRRVALAAPEDKFHMRAFSEQASCGTAYCLAGFAAIDPWFRTNTPINGILAPKWCNDQLYVAVAPGLMDLYPFLDNSKNSSSAFIGLAAIFGLTEDETDHLFGGSLSKFIGVHAVSKAEVLWNIDRILLGMPTLPYEASEDDEHPAPFASKDYDPPLTVV